MKTAVAVENSVFNNFYLDQFQRFYKHLLSEKKKPDFLKQDITMLHTEQPCSFAYSVEREAKKTAKITTRRGT